MPPPRYRGPQRHCFEKQVPMSSNSILKWSSLTLMVIGMSCMVAFRIIGSEVDAQGVLREPFALIPLGWLALAVGAILGVLYFLARIVAAVRAARTSK